MSLATYVRLSLERVYLLDALQRYLKNFMLNSHGQQERAVLTYEGGNGEGKWRPPAPSADMGASCSQAVPTLFSSSIFF